MSIQVALHHRTSYQYDRAIKLDPQVVRLRPAPHCRTRIESYSMRVTPSEHFLNWQQDPQANYLARLVFPERTREFSIEIDLVADLAIINPFDFFLEPHAEQFPFAYESQQRAELEPYLRTAATPAVVCEYLAAFKRAPMPTVPFLVEVNTKLASDIKYLVRMEAGLQSPEETLANRSGSCRDSAWLLVVMLRELGLAARFASGYLIQLTADVKSLDGPSGTERDFTDLHAWAEVFLPGAGWVGLDATSGLFAGEGHLPLACAANPTSAAPVTGSLEPCEVRFSHEMSIRRIDEKPRATRPLADADWRAIEALGHVVDRDLVAQDVRLTMGGEPTFVAIDHPDAAEWNTAALGDHKKTLAIDLYHRLRTRYGARGLVHFGQGKWYPGEQLPRWSLNCFWRVDGEPIWLDESLIADPSHAGTASPATAEVFLRNVAARLGFDGESVFAAHEDSLYYVWRERRLPVNVDAQDARLDDPLERARIARTFDHGLATAVGYVLPIARDPRTDTWRTGRWYLRTDRCFLIPGDSAMGYRLPLDSMPWTSAADYPYLHPRDPGANVAALAPHAELRVQTMSRSIPRGPAIGVVAPPASSAGASDRTVDRKPEQHESAAWIVRTALCAEVREGTLHLFMPPLEAIEDYLALVRVIEAVAASMRQPVRLEGYEPPRDARVQVFRVTPDPGVIEFNIHPSHNWPELVERTQFIYESARAARLTTEKFMLDGRHTGTGGGNHVVLGGATPADSPWLRRPDLLRSFVSFWNDHPSLSYLFAGLFIGPTSQAPRIDEARNDSVREIEIAFREMTRETERAGEVCAPWLVDRLLRNLLIDVTGNTHRAEFCIDKLYSPDSASGRLGLLELRAFEMPPHPSMSLVQVLLLRALVAWFWREPYTPSRLQRWGTTLHDRFMLPHYIWADFQAVIDAVRAGGYALDARWFAAQYEFRFPKYGAIQARDMTLEIRSALEPWHVLGEEGSAAGTVRYVDSSVERLQVKISGRLDDRFELTCNGYRLPLQATGSAGEYVAGVRYRAWQPATALHPTIPVHAPLTFDIIDRDVERSLAGCRYHVMHPGGRSFEHFPINAFEAEGRRLARFTPLSHTPGRVVAMPAAIDPEFPCTLDLRHIR